MGEEASLQQQGEAPETSQEEEVKLTPYQDKEGIWRIDNVPICSTGIEYKLSTGPVTFTESMLGDAVKATNDVAIKDPRIALGHSSEYNAAISDGEPAFGRVENLHLEDNNQTIYGDYVGMPEWLATVLPNAFPSRSIEGIPNVETVTGKKYELVITAVSQLGVLWPGCSVLEDLPIWYGTAIPADVEIVPADEAIAASGGGMKQKTKAEFEAAVDISLIRRKFYNDGPGSENWDYWVRGERFDSSSGYQLIVDMGNGELSRVPVEVNGSDVAFGDPVIVTEEYPDKAIAASAVLAGMASVDSDMVIYASRADSPDQPTRGGQMDDATRQKLAAKLGLPEDATEAQINAKMAEQVLASQSEGGGDGAPSTPEDPDPDEGEGEGEGGGEGGGEGVQAGADGIVHLDRVAYDRLKAGSDLALKHEKEQKANRIKDAVEAAVKDGRIPPARRKYWSESLAKDFDGFKAALDSLEPGLVPVTERGNGGGDHEGVEAGHEAGAGLPESWFPEIATLRAKASTPQVVTQAKEG